MQVWCLLPMDSYVYEIETGGMYVRIALRNKGSISLQIIGTFVNLKKQTIERNTRI